MTNVIGNIQNFAHIDPKDFPPGIAYTRDQIPKDAQSIIEKALIIDKLIDEANETTYLGKPMAEILELLVLESNEYEEKLSELDEYKIKGERWLEKIHQMMGFLTSNTPWYNDFSEEESE
ncbi:hypothetical protein GPJ56_001191 [Histomonas meleagridis]|nr:hypothetical protein GPJ56_001191 [Histomonas meleagridis]